MSLKMKFVQISIKNSKNFCYLVYKIAKKSRFSSKSYGLGGWIWIRKDPSILTDPDPDPSGQKSMDPDPRNPEIPSPMKSGRVKIARFMNEKSNFALIFQIKFDSNGFLFYIKFCYCEHMQKSLLALLDEPIAWYRTDV